MTLIKDLKLEFSILKDNSLKKQGQSNRFLVCRVRRNGRNDVHDNAVTLRWPHGGKLIFDTGLSSGCIFTIQVRSVVFIQRFLQVDYRRCVRRQFNFRGNDLSTCQWILCLNFRDRDIRSQPYEDNSLKVRLLHGFGNSTTITSNIISI